MARASLKPSPLRVLFATSECAPLTKTGGLGDVSAALPPALERLKMDVKVLLPGYRGVLDAVPGGEAARHASISAPPVECRLIGAELPVRRAVASSSIARPSTGATAARTRTPRARTGPTTRCASASCRRSPRCWEAAASPLDWRPHVVHCNDWQTGLAPAYLHYQAAPRAATVMTVHNLAFHGSFPAGARVRAGTARRELRHGGPGVLRAHVVPQGGTLLCRRHHHREPDLRARDPDRRATAAAWTACCARAAAC